MTISITQQDDDSFTIRIGGGEAAVIHWLCTYATPSIMEELFQAALESADWNDEDGNSFLHTMLIAAKLYG